VEEEEAAKGGGGIRARMDRAGSARVRGCGRAGARGRRLRGRLALPRLALVRHRPGGRGSMRNASPEAAA
jgi:hypothetical protein